MNSLPVEILQYICAFLNAHDQFMLNQAFHLSFITNKIRRDELVNYFAEHNYMSCLKWAHENHYTRNDKTMVCAASGGHLRCMKWLFIHHCSIYPNVFCQAARYGHLHCMQWAHQYSIMKHNDITYYAVEGGQHLHCLKYAYDNGCKLDEKISYVAAHYGHLHILKYLLKLNHKFKKKMCAQAAFNNHLHILQWAKKYDLFSHQLVCDMQHSMVICKYYRRIFLELY